MQLLRFFVPLGFVSACFAACTGDDPVAIDPVADASTTADGSSAIDAAVTDGQAASDATDEDADASVDAGPICAAAPAVGERIVAACSAVGLTLISALPDAGTYELQGVTATANGTCAGNTVQDKPWKGAVTITATNETEREAHLRLLPPDGDVDGTVETVYHFALLEAEDGTKLIRALCNSPLPIQNVESDAADAGDPTLSVGKNFGDAGLGSFAIRLSALADPQADSTTAVFRFQPTE